MLEFLINNQYLLGIVSGAIISTFLYILNGYIDLYVFERIKNNRDEKKNKKALLNHAINELELNRLKINNFIDLLVRIEQIESLARIPFNLNLEIKEKFEVYSHNYENLFFSNIEFKEDFKKELLSIYNKLLDYRNHLNNIYLCATPNYFSKEHEFWQKTKDLRGSEFVLWINHLKNLDDFINKLKQYK